MSIRSRTILYCDVKTCSGRLDGIGLKRRELRRSAAMIGWRSFGRLVDYCPDHTINPSAHRLMEPAPDERSAA